MAKNAKNPVKKTVKKSTYKVDVLAANNAYKAHVRSVGKGLRVLKGILTDEVKTNPALKPMLNHIKKVLADPKLYEQINKHVRRSTAEKTKGQTTPYFILQKLYAQKEGKPLTKVEKKPTKKGKASQVKSDSSKENKTVSKGSIKKNVPSLQGQKVAELRKIAKNLNINKVSTLNKADLIQAIKTANAA